MAKDAKEKEEGLELVKNKENSDSKEIAKTEASNTNSEEVQSLEAETVRAEEISTEKVDASSLSMEDLDSLLSSMDTMKATINIAAEIRSYKKNISDFVGVEERMILIGRKKIASKDESEEDYTGLIFALKDKSTIIIADAMVISTLDTAPLYSVWDICAKGLVSSSKGREYVDFSIVPVV